MPANDNKVKIQPQLDVKNTIHINPELKTNTINAISDFDKMVTTDGAQILTNKTIDALYNTLLNISLDNFAKNIIVTYIENKDIASNKHIPTEKAVAEAISKATFDKLTARNLQAGKNIELEVIGNNVVIHSTTDVTGLLKSDGSVPMDIDYDPVSEQDVTTKSYVDTNIDVKTASKLEQGNIVAGDNIHVEEGTNNDVIISADKTIIVAGDNVHVEEGTGGSTIISADNTEIVAGKNISIEEEPDGAVKVNAEVDYTNANGCIAVGGIKAGTTFENMTMKDMWDLLLYPELYPTLSNPSISISRNPSTSYYEIGTTINFTVTASFNRGSINPAYGTSGYRSGLPNKYTFTGAQMTDVETTALSVSKSVSNYTVSEGSQSWSCKVYYDAGEQPKSNKGADYSTPLPAGSVSGSVSFTGVYPYFATTSNLNTLSKQALTSMTSTYVQVTMVAESDQSSQKQRIEFPKAWKNITGVQFLNTLNNTWEWIDGNKANSLLSFTKTNTTETVQGAEVEYYLYTNNKSTTGSRQLRFYTN